MASRHVHSVSQLSCFRMLVRCSRLCVSFAHAERPAAGERVSKARGTMPWPTARKEPFHFQTFSMFACVPGQPGQGRLTLRHQLVPYVGPPPRGEHAGKGYSDLHSSYDGANCAAAVTHGLQRLGTLCEGLFACFDPSTYYLNPKRR